MRTLQFSTVFTEGSIAISDWKEGSKVLFLSGTGNGMYSMIDKNIANNHMTFKHMGEVKEAVKLPYGETKEWIDVMETRTLKKKSDIIHLTTTFPKALEN